GQALEHLRDAVALVVGVQAAHPGLDTQAAEQSTGPAGILGGDELRLPQDPDGAQGDVFQVPDGRRDDKQPPRSRPRKHASYCTLRDRAMSARRSLPPFETANCSCACDLLKRSRTLRPTTWAGATKRSPPTRRSTGSICTTTSSRTSRGRRSIARCATSTVSPAGWRRCQWR